MSKNNSETVTISKAEYEYLTGLKDLEKHCAQLESELNWLKEQLQISKKKTFGSSSERKNLQTRRLHVAKTDGSECSTSEPPSQVPEKALGRCLY